MRDVQELLDRLIPFVVVPFKGVGEGVPESALGLTYLHELELEELNITEVLCND